jgi:rRNA maturation protein Rpf1
MKVTTSRDPSVKARRLAKTLARFLTLPYITRGKQNLDPTETWLIVVERHGNPNGLIKRYEGEERELTFSVPMEPQSSQIRKLKKIMPVITGVKEEAKSVAEFFELRWSPDAIGRIIVVGHERIDFLNEGETVLRLKR